MVVKKNWKVCPISTLQTEQNFFYDEIGDLSQNVF